MLTLIHRPTNTEINLRDFNDIYPQINTHHSLLKYTPVCYHIVLQDFEADYQQCDYVVHSDLGLILYFRIVTC